MSTQTTSPETSAADNPGPGRTVRDATFDLLRRRGLTRMFANPGSTEIPFLSGLPGDLEFVLGLHEGSVIGMATGYAIGRGKPSIALLHTTAGLGNAVGAIATARVNRAPVVIVVGQQDRRHLSYEPFLSGRLAGLAGEYPVRVEQPATAQDVPAAIERASHAALNARGPALVIVPMDDWEAPADDTREPAAAVGRVLRAQAAHSDSVKALVGFLQSSSAPAIVVGAGADDADTWAALVKLADRLAAPVYEAAFEARAGFPQDHPRFAGFLPAERSRLRERLAEHDAVLVVGAPAFRVTLYTPGAFTNPGTRLAVVTDEAEEAYRSPSELAILAHPAAVCLAAAEALPRREGDAPERSAPPVPERGERLTSFNVLHELAQRLPRNAVVLEEAPVDRPHITTYLPAREPLGYLSAAMGGLGFAIPGATGLRMAQPNRPIVAIVGDGSSIYGIQGVWSAAHYRAGAIFVVLSNGGYAIMDRLAEAHGDPGPWPSFDEIDLSAVARGFGCPARRIQTHEELEATLDELVPTLGEREEPLFLDVVVDSTPEFTA